MFISQLALTSFRSADSIVLDTNAPRVYIVGRNGVGKSSVKEAIRWTLRGICSGTDGKGSGWESLLPSQNQALIAGVRVQGLGMVTRAYKNGTRELLVEGRPADLASSQAGLYANLNVTPDVLDAVLETSQFLRLHHGDAKAMILGVLNVTIPVGEERLTLAQVEGRYKTAFQDRQTAKARAKGHTVPSPVTGERLPQPEQVKGLLDGLKRQLEAAIAERGGDDAKRAHLEAELRRSQAIPVRQVGPEPMRTVPPQADHLRQQIAEAEASLTALAAEVSENAPPSPDALMDALRNHHPSGGCVIDPGVPCKTPKVNFTNRAKFYASQAHAEARQTLDLTPLNTQLDLSALRAKLKALEEQERARADAIAHNTRRQSDLDALTAQIASLPPVQDSSTVETLRARIAKGELVLQTAKDQERQATAYEVGLKQKQALEADVARLEELCEVLGPNGARVKALGDAIGAFETSINQTTEAFGGFHVAFELEPWKVIVNGRPVETFSRSEQYRIGIAIQVALAVASGLGFVVVDELDMLDRLNRQQVGQWLLRPIPGLQQAIILSTQDDDKPLPKVPVEGIKFYRLAKQEKRTVVAEAI